MFEMFFCDKCKLLEATPSLLFASNVILEAVERVSKYALGRSQSFSKGSFNQKPESFSMNKD